MYLESKANNALWHNCHKVPQENQSLVFPAFWQVSCSFSLTAHLSDKCFPTGQFKDRLGFQFQFSFGLEFPGADFSFAREITSNPSIRLGSFIPSALSHVGSAHQNFTNHSLSKIAHYLPISQNSSFPVFGVRDSYLVLSGKLIGSCPMVTLLLLTACWKAPPWRTAMRLGVCLFSTKMRLGLPWWLSDTESACSAADPGSIPRSGRSPSKEDPPEKGMATRCSILAWRIPWTEEPERLQSMGSQRVGHDWSDWACTHARWDWLLTQEASFLMSSQCLELLLGTRCLGNVARSCWVTAQVGVPAVHFQVVPPCFLGSLHARTHTHTHTYTLAHRSIKERKCHHIFPLNIEKEELDMYACHAVWPQEMASPCDRQSR